MLLKTLGTPAILVNNAAVVRRGTLGAGETENQLLLKP